MLSLYSCYNDNIFIATNLVENMRELYVVVHENGIRWENIKTRGVIEIAKLKFNLWNIKRKNYIPVDGNPRILPKGIPEPSNDLEVLVCDAYNGACVKNQFDALKENGYSVSIYEPACLGGGGYSELGLAGRIRWHVFDYFFETRRKYRKRARYNHYLKQKKMRQ